MNVDVYTAIADYLRKTQDEVIWPLVGNPQAATHQASGTVPAYRPDMLWLIRLNLMKWYIRAIVIFPPPSNRTKCRTDSECPEGYICVDGKCVVARSERSELRQKCTTDDDCAQDEICVGGVCVPDLDKTASALRGGGCTTDDDCAQDEICYGGVCVPSPWDEGYEPVPLSTTTSSPTPNNDLKEAIDSYLGRIYRVVVSGLAAKPSKLGAVRDLLTNARADVMKLAGIGTPCKTSADCSQDHVCIKGICVKVPFRLGYRAIGSKPPAPWI